jgi:PAS domain S-box-containing protein
VVDLVLVVLLFGALLMLQFRRQASLASRLRMAEARARIAVDSVSDYAILTLDNRGHVTSWNAGAERIKAYRRDEILGQHFSRFYPPEEVELGTPQRLLDRAAAEGKVVHEGWRLRKDGSRFWAHVVITALRNEDGALRGFGKLTSDLTATKLTEDALQLSEGRFRAIFNQAAVGIGEVSLEGQWLRVNPRMCEIVGYPPDELLHKNIRDCTHPEDLEVTSAHALNVVANPGRSYSLEKRYVRKDGTLVWVSLSSVLVKAPGDQPDYIVGVVEDISDRKRAEIEAAELRSRLEQRVHQRTAELAEANRRLESFSYSVSHDLRTPLRAISGFAQILARRHRDGLGDEGRHYMDNIVRASAQMGRLIEDLLDYSRLGRKSIVMQDVDLQACVGDIALMLQPKTAELDAVLRIGPLPRALGDLTLLTQIFLNLLENAITYRRAGVAPRIDVTARADGAEIIVSVSDNGIGIDAAHFDLIFGIFQRLHSEEDYPGTGIGLATVRQAAEMLGGRVWVESQPGAGSTFYVRLRGARSHEPCASTEIQAQMLSR